MIINKSKIIIGLLIGGIIAGGFVALIYSLYEMKIGGVLEYSRDLLYVDLQQNVGHNYIKVLFEDEEDENLGGVFLPAFSDFSEATLCCKGDFSIKVEGEIISDTILLSDFSEGQSIHVEILNNRKEAVDEFFVKFYISGNVPAIFLDTESGTIDYIHEDKNNIETSTLKIVDSTGNLVYGGAATISGRGNSTWNPRNRKPYNIVLDDSASLLGMNTGKNWCLLANRYDDTFLSNVLAYDMAKSCGMKYTPNARFIDLYLNGEYRGLYLLTEDIVVEKGRLDIPSLSDSNKQANPGTFFEQNEVLETDDMRWVDMENNPRDISGGYFLERDRRTLRDFIEEQRKSPPSWFLTSYGTPIRIKDPAYASKEEVEYIKSYFQEMEEAIRNKDGVNPTTNKKYTEYIDVESWVKWYIVAEIIVDRDKNYTNVYMYKYPDSIDSRIFAGPVWDYDGRWYNDPESLSKLQVGEWIPNLYEQEEFYQQILYEWKNEFSPYLKNEAPKLIDEYEEYLLKAVEMDVARWGGHVEAINFLATNKTEFNRDYNFHANLQRLKTWIAIRENYLSECWE